MEDNACKLGKVGGVLQVYLPGIETTRVCRSAMMLFEMKGGKKAHAKGKEGGGLMGLDNYPSILHSSALCEGVV